MQKTKYFMLFGLLFFLCLDSVYAACSTNELNEFKRIKDDYKVTYEFNQKTKHTPYILITLIMINLVIP